MGQILALVKCELRVVQSSRKYRGAAHPIWVLLASSLEMSDLVYFPVVGSILSNLRKPTLSSENLRIDMLSFSIGPRNVLLRRRDPVF